LGVKRGSGDADHSVEFANSPAVKGLKINATGRSKR
jgi:hypothetical protein